MPDQHVARGREQFFVWSAASCRLGGAYVGLAPFGEAAAIVAALTARRAALYAGPRVAMRVPEAWQSVYLAVRDPSVVRVGPIHGYGLERRGEHVSLRFATPPLAATPRTANHSLEPFVLTVGFDPRLERTLLAALGGSDGRGWDSLLETIDSARVMLHSDRRRFRDTGS